MKETDIGDTIDKRTRHVEFIDERTNSSATNAQLYEIGVYGWRKRFLYVLLVILTVSVIFNAILTIWIIRALRLSMLGMGMGSLKLHSRGITLNGDAYFSEELYTASINANSNSPFKIESKDNLTLSVRKHETGELINRIAVNNSSLDAFVNQFAIRSPNGKLKLLVDERNLFVDDLNLRINNNAGITLSGSIQTPFVRSYLSESLRIISPTRTVTVKAATGMVIESLAAGIGVTSLKDLSLQSKYGKLTIEGTGIVMHGLQVVNPENYPKRGNEVYQLCTCSRNGKLFLAEPNKQCLYDSKICFGI